MRRQLTILAISMTLCATAASAPAPTSATAVASTTAAASTIAATATAEASTTAATATAEASTTAATATATATATASATAMAEARYVPLAGGVLRSVLPADGKQAPALVAPFAMRATPVSNAEFRRFANARPEWQRGRPGAVLASSTYLAGWRDAADYGALAADAPVTNISWHAAAAFCASEGARLPRWHEWEYAAAADETRADARDDAQWLARILNWYARPASTPPGGVGRTAPNHHGLHDMHGLVWEWVEDYSALFVNADGRAQDARKQLDYCGGAALSLGDRRNYAVLMRIALLAAMEGAQDGAYLGFRCARDTAAEPHTSGETP